MKNIFILEFTGIINFTDVDHTSYSIINFIDKDFSGIINFKDAVLYWYYKVHNIRYIVLGYHKELILYVLVCIFIFKNKLFDCKNQNFV